MSKPPVDLNKLNDLELLAQVKEAFAGDLAVEACVAECLAAIDKPLIERMALTKKLSYACGTAPLSAPAPSLLAVSMSQRVH